MLEELDGGRDRLGVELVESRAPTPERGLCQNLLADLGAEQGVQLLGPLADGGERALLATTRPVRLARFTASSAVELVQGVGDGERVNSESTSLLAEDQAPAIGEVDAVIGRIGSAFDREGSDRNVVGESRPQEMRRESRDALRDGGVTRRVRGCGPHQLARVVAQPHVETPPAVSLAQALEQALA